MKTGTSVKAILLAITLLCLVGVTLGTILITLSTKTKYTSENKRVLDESTIEIPNTTIAKAETSNIMEADLTKKETNEYEITVASATTEEEVIKQQLSTEIVYDGMTLDELASKLDKSLGSTLTDQGYTFALSAVELGIDPYLAVAIVLHETGCEWSCSTLLKECNNVGGMKGGGSGSCNGGSYARFDTLEDGIEAYMNNLYNNYFSQGLTTPETIGPKYAASTTWATQVNSYINKIKAA